MNNIEATLYYTVNDARDLINDIGLSSFLEALFTENKSRLLTVEEIRPCNYCTTTGSYDGL